MDYTITDTNSGAVLNNGGGFSNAMRWFLYWDDNNQLWTHNSDMGPFGVWTYDGQSQFVLHKISAGDPVLATAPLTVVDNLPNTLKKRLNLK